MTCIFAIDTVSNDPEFQIDKITKFIDVIPPKGSCVKLPVISVASKPSKWSSLSGRVESVEYDYTSLSSLTVNVRVSFMHFNK